MKDFLVLCLLFVCTVSGQYDCEGQESDSFVADPKDCRMYYVCRGDQPAYHAMCPQTPLPTLFNFNLQACTNTANTCVPDPCYNETGIFVPDVSGVCGYWHFCLEGDVSHSGQCPHNLSFDPITQFCTYPHCSGDEDSVFYF